MKAPPLILAALLLLPACGEDDPVIPVPPPQKFENLTQKWHVLNNLELAYNKRNASRYEELLDADFTFYLAPRDLGLKVPTSWDRQGDAALHERLFDPELDDPVAPRCQFIDMNVYFQDGVQWTAYPGGGGPVDTLFTTAVYYDFTIAIERPEDPDVTFLAIPGSKLEITVRNVGTPETPAWRMVTMSDLGAANLVAGRTMMSTEEATLGQIKALYLPPPAYSPLAERDDVLRDLELAYNWRDIAALDDILDVDFTFFLSFGDVGGDLPAQWGRADEILQTSRLFDRKLSQPPYPRCRSIAVDLLFDEVQWIEVLPESAPDEVWYTTTVFYDFTIQIDPDWTYPSVPGAKSQFTVRNDGTEESPSWRLVEWRDLGAASATVVSLGASSETASWGSIKALYR